mgnify:CR=1 FL=1
MIVFDLNCCNGHEFEGWFSSTEDYNMQLKKKQVRCPICSSHKVEKSLMAPNIQSKKNTNKSILGKKKNLDKEKKLDQKDILIQLRKLQKYIEKNSDDVGKRFAEEARKMYYEESDARAIRGEATQEEAEELNEEGIPFARIPSLPREDA